MADMIVVNKCDGSLQSAANSTVSDYTSAVKLSRSSLFSSSFSSSSGFKWIPPVLPISSISGKGLDTVYENIMKFKEMSIVRSAF